MYEKVHEKIKVRVDFKEQDPDIKGFVWKNKDYSVSRINLITRARKGQIPVFLFSVSNDAGAYELRFDTDTLQWFIEQVYWKI